MKIGAIGSAPMQQAAGSRQQVVDTKSKELQAQITTAQNKLQQISSDPNMSDEEKSRLRQELQKQISELNNQLMKHQLEVRQKQQQSREAQNTSQDTRQTEDSKQAEDTQNRTQEQTQSEDTRRMQDMQKSRDDHRAFEASRIQDERRAEALKMQDNRRAEARRLQENNRLKDAGQIQDTRRVEDNAPVQDVRQTQNTSPVEDSYAEKLQIDDDRVKTPDISTEEIKAMVSADTAVKHAATQGQVSAALSNEALVIEGEIKQDTRNSRDVKNREAELEVIEQKASSATNAQMSILSDASGSVRKVNVKDNVSKIPTSYNRTNVAEKSAKIATGFSPDNTANQNRVNAYSKGKTFSSVKFSF